MLVYNTTTKRIEFLVELDNGSGGGTSNYIDLTNKPQINGITLIGNKSSEDLGIATGKIKILNVVETGSLTRDGAVYSGFSNSNYLQLGDKVNGDLLDISNKIKDFGAVCETANSWKVKMKFKYVAGGTADMQTIFNMNTAYGSQISIQKSSDKLLWQFSNSSGGSSISGGDEIGATTLVDGQTYWVIMEFTGTAYQVSLSTDGINFELEKTPTASTEKLTNRAKWVIGTMISDNRNFMGEIDVEGWEIEVDGQVWWKGVEDITATGDIDLPAYLKKPTIVTDGDNTNLTVAGNTIYKFGVIDELVLSSAEVSDSETIIYFTTDSTIIFTDNSGVRWGGGNEQPTLEPNTVYCIAIRNGLAEIDNFGSAS